MRPIIHILMRKEIEMAKKTLKKKVLKKSAPAKSAAENFAAPVVESAREIWLAGLGAFSVAQAESGKLIEQGNMRKSEGDQLSDFYEVYDFDEAFDRQYCVDISKAFRR